MNKTVSKLIFLSRVALHPMESLRQLRNWQLIEDKIGFWKTNREKIALWMDYESVVTKAVNDKLQQEGTLSQVRQRFRYLSKFIRQTVTRFALRRNDVLACFDDLLDETPLDPALFSELQRISGGCRIVGA